MTPQTLRRRAAVLALAMLGTTAAAASGPVAEPAAALSGTVDVRVLTYNIHSAISGAGTDLPAIAAEIRASGAQVVLLQEVDRNYGARSGWVDQPAELARLTGMSVVFGPAIDRAPASAGAPRRQSGNAVLFAGSILGSANTTLPDANTGEPRAILRATVRLAGVKTDFYATHLHYELDSLRAAQAREVVAVTNARTCPKVLGGDFNSKPTEQPIQIIGANMRDAWLDAGSGTGATQPAARPTRRVDYIFRDTWSSTVNTAVRPLTVSDHRGVVTTLRLDRDAYGLC